MRVIGSDPDRYWRASSLVAKAALAGLLLFALTHRDWDRFADKAMGTRAIAYPLVALLVPVAWAVWRRLRGPVRYPWDVDVFLVAPFVIDVAGNAADLYDSVSWFDDACHFGNWALLGAAVGAGLRRGPAQPPFVLALCCTGLGAIAAILWELAEYLTFIMGTPETVGIYRDTLGDEALGLSGAAVAGVLTALRARAAAGAGPVPHADSRPT
ncbi:hypothetical protein GCM10023196_104680 [Actinoallomurus vinaceus]|uniref:DUF2238 domain-containing protein n=1 Tax=Actinoallomurus vinaceus TaxID=1080074 RepID=A0ABP8UWE6_9ACTN